MYKRWLAIRRNYHTNETARRAFETVRGLAFGVVVLFGMMLTVSNILVAFWLVVGSVWLLWQIIRDAFELRIPEDEDETLDKALIVVRDAGYIVLEPKDVIIREGA